MLKKNVLRYAEGMVFQWENKEAENKLKIKMKIKQRYSTCSLVQH